MSRAQQQQEASWKIVTARRRRARSCTPKLPFLRPPSATQAIMARLEAEHAMAREQLKEEFRRREEAAAGQHAAALKEARKAEAKMAERFRAAGLAGQVRARLGAQAKGQRAVARSTLCGWWPLVGADLMKAGVGVLVLACTPCHESYAPWCHRNALLHPSGFSGGRHGKQFEVVAESGTCRDAPACRATRCRLQAAEERVGSSELQLKELRRELESKSSTIRWLESQVGNQHNTAGPTPL